MYVVYDVWLFAANTKASRRDAGRLSSLNRFKNFLEFKVYCLVSITIQV